MIQDFRDEYSRYRQLGEKALAQTPDDALNLSHAPEGNSAAMIVWHVSGNLRSRFSDFLTTDGEKPWRVRDEEFESRSVTRAEVDAKWAAGWDVLDATLATLTDGDMARTITIRGQPLTVHAALCRSIAHVSNHVGQLILIGRMTAPHWESLSIPRGQSTQYNRNPTHEKKPR
jgi:hypothetical protein